MKFRANRMVGIALILVSFLFISGCSLEDMLEELTTRGITDTRTLYDGDLSRSATTLALAEDLVVSAGTNVEAGLADLSDFEEQLFLIGEGIDTMSFSLNAALSNVSSQPMIVSFSLVPGQGGTSKKIGSVEVLPDEMVEIARSQGMTSSDSQVSENLKNFFDDNPAAKSVKLYLQVSGSNGDLEVHRVSLEASPMFSRAFDDAVEGIFNYSGYIQSVDKVQMWGSIENEGIADIRFMMVLSDKEGIPDFTDGVILDGIVEPGQKQDVEDLMEENGEELILSMLRKAADGDCREANVYMMSDEKIEADVDDLTIKVWMTVSL